MPAALEGVGPTGHLCLCYESEAEQLAGSIPFLLRGLAAGDQCVYVAADPGPTPMLDALQSRGVDVAAARRSGALAILPREESYLQDGSFDPERMLSWIQARADAGIRAGFSGLRLISELACLAGPHPGVERLAEYEAKLNRMLMGAGQSLSALCSYDRNRCARAEVRESLATHPLLLVGGTACANPHFVPPEQYLAADWPTGEVAWLLARARAVQDAADQQAGERERHRVLLRSLLEKQELEQRALARDLHDDLAQLLTALHLRLQQPAPDQPPASNEPAATPPPCWPRRWSTCTS